jgi:hypothetical protein
MSHATMSPEAARDLERLREQGCQVIGPGAMTPGQTPPAGPVREPLPGSHVQIRCGERFVEGFGGTPDEAVRDAIAKLDGIDVSARPIG